MTTNHTDEPFVLLVVGDMESRQVRMIELLKEKYGDRLKIVNQDDDGVINGMCIDYMIMDEMLAHVPVIDVDNSFKLRGREYWQRGRW